MFSTILLFFVFATVSTFFRFQKSPFFVGILSIFFFIFFRFLFLSVSYYPQVLTYIFVIFLYSGPCLQKCHFFCLYVLSRHSDCVYKYVTLIFPSFLYSGANLQLQRICKGKRNDLANLQLCTLQKCQASMPFRLVCLQMQIIFISADVRKLFWRWHVCMPPFFLF